MSQALRLMISRQVSCLSRIADAFPGDDRSDHGGGEKAEVDDDTCKLDGTDPICHRKFHFVHAKTSLDYAHPPMG